MKQFRKSRSIVAAFVSVALVASCGGDDSDADAEEVESTEVETTDVESTEVESTEVESTDVQSTDVESDDAICEGADLEKIGYSPYAMSFEYFQFTVRGMEEEAAKCGVEVVVHDPQGDAAEQVSGIENLLSAGAEAIAIVSVDPIAIETAVKAAHDQDRPVISQVSTFEGADVYVGLPESEFGRLQGLGAGEALLESKPGKDSYKVAILNADLLGTGLIDRKNGTLDGLTEAGVNFEVVADVEALGEEAALTATETILQAHPDLDFIVTVNDPGSLGARSAVIAAGKELNIDVVIGANGIDKRVLEGVIAGDFPVSVSPEPVAIGRELVRIALAISAGRDVAAQIELPPVLVTQDNAQDILTSLYGE